MARKNLLVSVTAAGQNPPSPPAPAEDDARHDYTRHGASGSMRRSLDELAENSKRLIEGETVVSLDPALVDDSPVADRLDDDGTEYAEIREAIRESGQLTPILVRPNPKIEGRFIIVFGHRRTRAARELGIHVRAVVKPMEEVAQVIAQGQENTARSGYSFIEKALYGATLLRMGHTKDTVKSALMVDDTLLSRMLSVAETVPDVVIRGTGAAKSVGRDRWEELKKLISVPGGKDLAAQIVQSDEFIGQQGDARFVHLLSTIKAAQAAARKRGRPKAEISTWAPADKSVSATARSTGTTFDITLKAKNASEFGQYISANLDALYQAFTDAKIHKAGD